MGKLENDSARNRSGGRAGSTGENQNARENVGTEHNCYHLTNYRTETEAQLVNGQAPHYEEWSKEWTGCATFFSSIAQELGLKSRAHTPSGQLGSEVKLGLTDAGVPYERALRAKVGDVVLDPIYEAECLPFLMEGDLLWVVGCRESV